MVFDRGAFDLLAHSVSLLRPADVGHGKPEPPGDTVRKRDRGRTRANNDLRLGTRKLERLRERRIDQGTFPRMGGQDTTVDVDWTEKARFVPEGIGWPEADSLDIQENLGRVVLR